MKQIRITTVAELITFIEDNELDFDKYLEIVHAYIGQMFIWFGKEDKTLLIAEINRFRYAIENNCATGIFWNSKDYYDSEEWKLIHEQMQNE